MKTSPSTTTRASGRTRTATDQSAKKDAESEDKKANEREQKWKEMVAQHAKLKG